MITIDLLIKNGVFKDDCKDSMIIFESEWPTGAAVTKENFFRAIELGLDVRPLAVLLKDNIRKEYNKVRYNPSLDKDLGTVRAGEVCNQTLLDCLIQNFGKNNERH